MKQPPPLIIILAIITLLTACREATVVGPEDVETATPQATATPTTREVTALTPTTIQPVSVKETSAPVVTVISDEPLLSEEQLSVMGVKENESVSVIAWPVENEMVLQVGNQADGTIWRLSKDAGMVERIPNLPVSETPTEQAVKELQKYNEAVNYAVVSPDGQWAAWAAWETLLVKRLGTNEPPIDLLGVEYERFEGGSNTLVWSPDSKNVAYVVKNDNAGHYEIRISDPLGKTINVLPLWNTRPSPIVWSPDGQYLAFNTLEQPQSGINHIYLFGQDGNGLTQVTEHGLAKNPIHWSPTNTAIVYTHGTGDGSNPWLVTFEIR